MTDSNDTVICALCGYEAIDLSWHLRKQHDMLPSKYKEKYGEFVSSSVAEKRRSTNMERYGVSHYTNRPAAALTNKWFTGGHSLRDPEVRKRAEETKLKKYGDAKYTNRSKAKATCLNKYGVAYAGSIPAAIEKRLETLKERYGKVFNVEVPHNKTSVPEGFVSDYTLGMSMELLSKKYGVSDPTLRRWAEEKSISRKNTVVTSKSVESPMDVVSGYFGACDEVGRVLSFYDYGEIRGRRLTTKMKRLFNAGKPYAGMKNGLFGAASDKRLRDAFFAELQDARS